MTELLTLIDSEIAKLQEMKAILSAETPSLVAKKRGRPAGSKNAPVKAKRTMSPEGKAKIAAAQKKRWAASKRAAKKAASQEAVAA